MAVDTFAFTTGPATLLDVGTLFYNGCTFSPLFISNLSGKIVKDNAQRTTKFLEIVLEAEGYVTAEDGDTIDVAMANLYSMLTAQAGTLHYAGRGFDLLVNGGGVTTFNNLARDLAWGPVPEVLDFQPMGQALSAKVKWKVTLRLTTQTHVSGHTPGDGQPLLQFNCETSVSYGEDYYSALSIKGTMEVPITRPTQGTRTLTSTVDDARSQLDSRIFRGVDLSRFRVTKRDYNMSRDKRTLEFDVSLEEKPYMDLPVGCSTARGSFSVRPAKAGMGLVSWMCTLRVTYTVRKDQSRRWAWVNFLALLRWRMQWATSGIVPPMSTGGGGTAAAVASGTVGLVRGLFGGAFGPVTFGGVFGAAGAAATPAVGQTVPVPRRAAGPPCWLMDFSVEEGLYLDSKTTTFSASWKLITTFDRILVASGLWRKLAEENNTGGNLWAISMRDVSGSESWLANKLDPAQDVIVDFGGG